MNPDDYYIFNRCPKTQDKKHSWKPRLKIEGREKREMCEHCGRIRIIDAMMVTK